MNCFGGTNHCNPFGKAVGNLGLGDLRSYSTGRYMGDKGGQCRKLSYMLGDSEIRCLLGWQKESS